MPKAGAKIALNQESTRHSAATLQDHAAEAGVSSRKLSSVLLPPMPPYLNSRTQTTVCLVSNSLEQHSQKLSDHSTDLMQRAATVEGSGVDVVHVNGHTYDIPAPQGPNQKQVNSYIKSGTSPKELDAIFKARQAKHWAPPPPPPPGAVQPPRLEKAPNNLPPQSKKQLDQEYSNALWNKLSLTTSLPKDAQASARNAPGPSISGRKFLDFAVGPHIAALVPGVAGSHKTSAGGVLTDLAFDLPWDKAAGVGLKGIEATGKGIEDVQRARRLKAEESALAKARDLKANPPPDRPRGPTPDSALLPNGKSKINGHLAGSEHPKTGVPFTKQGDPKFPYIDKTQIKGGSTGNRNLDRAIAKKQLAEAGHPLDANHVLHHGPKDGEMQVVHKDLHGATGHTGGFSNPVQPGPVASAAGKTTDALKAGAAKLAANPKAQAVAQAARIVDGVPKGGGVAVVNSSQNTPTPPKKPTVSPQPSDSTSAPNAQAASTAARKQSDARQASQAETTTKHAIAGTKK